MAHQVRHRLSVVARGHQCLIARQQFGVSAPLVDGEVIDHRLHGEGDGRFQPSLRRGHNLLQAHLGPRFHGRIKHKAHAAARHAAHHPEAPKLGLEFLVHLANQRFGIQRSCPGDDGLDWPKEVALRRRANGAHVLTLQQIEDLVDNADRLLPALPFGLRAQQVLLRHHLQNRAYVLGHTTVDHHQAVLQLLAHGRRGVFGGQDAVIGQQSPPADAILRVGLARFNALNHLHARPYAA